MFALVISLALVLLASLWRIASVSAPTMTDVNEVFEQGDLVAAERLLNEILALTPQQQEALQFAGKLAFQNQRYDEAMLFFRQVEDHYETKWIETLYEAGDFSLRAGRLSDGEEYLRRALQLDPGHVAATKLLLYVLKIEGRNWEARDFLLAAFKAGTCTTEDLLLVASIEACWYAPSVDGQFLELCRRELPADPIWQMGPIRKQIANGERTEKTVAALREILVSRPNLLEMQVQLGKSLFELGNDLEFIAWNVDLPAFAEDHPEIWATRGRWASARGDTHGAIRCFWEATQRYPEHRAAHLQLANLLSEIKLDAAADAFRRRGQDLLRFDDLFLRGKSLPDGRPALVTATEIIEVLVRLGRNWEAVEWSKFVLSLDSKSKVANQTIDSVNRTLSPAMPWTAPEYNVSELYDFSHFSLPQWKSSGQTREKLAGVVPSRIAFDNVAEMVGLRFSHFVDQRRKAAKVFTFDFGGGGVGVADFDGDGWPDLYLTQSCVWPKSDSASTQQNALFRNIGGERFEDVTRESLLGDTGMGHGVSAGDFNHDGFTDIYICNVGENCLYRNNGDGSFSKCSDAFAEVKNDFSLSAALADFSGDGLPDLYVVNYLAGDARSRQCQRNGRLVQCMPIDFPGEQDCLYLNLGNGEFRDVSREVGVASADKMSALFGKGMGVVAADFDDSGSLDLYVANDGTANTFWVSELNRLPEGLRFREEGAFAGCAYDDLGRLQGSMGTAVGDVNQDGRLDIFVTNFYRENNNLFVQTGDDQALLFNDQSTETGLAATAMNTMGWGAQFLDADLDGDLDLVVANGQLDAASAIPNPDRMPTQFYENLAEGRFRELTAASMGPYFSTKRYGRAIAKLDWNRDGRNDFCITHMGETVGLLSNSTSDCGNFLALQLRGVESSRDAIGARIRFICGGLVRMVQLMAGDGFEASNQRQVLLGLGTHSQVEELEILWPSGRRQKFFELTINQEILIIEGDMMPHVLTRKKS